MDILADTREPAPTGTSRHVPAALAFSLPQSVAGGNCPRCETPFHFQTKKDNRPKSLNGKFLRCRCGHILGEYRVRVAGMVWLCVIAPGALPIIDKTTLPAV